MERTDNMLARHCFPGDRYNRERGGREEEREGRRREKREREGGRKGET